MPLGSGAMKDRRTLGAGPVVLRSRSHRLAVRLLTGSLGRFVAFVLDVSEASAVFFERISASSFWRRFKGSEAIETARCRTVLRSLEY